MSNQSKAVNDFFRDALRKDVDSLLENLVLTDRQNMIFMMKYVKGYDINFIADTLGCCSRVIQKELKKIRAKIAKHLGI